MPEFVSNSVGDPGSNTFAPRKKRPIATFVRTIVFTSAAIPITAPRRGKPLRAVLAYGALLGKVDMGLRYRILVSFGGTAAAALASTYVPASP